MCVQQFRLGVASPSLLEGQAWAVFGASLMMRFFFSDEYWMDAFVSVAPWK